MAGDSVQIGSNLKVNSQVSNTQASKKLAQLEKPPIITSDLTGIKKLRSENVNAFIASLAKGQDKGIANILAMSANEQMAKDFEALFGKDSALVKTANDLKANENNIDHLKSIENANKSITLRYMHHGLEELKTALKMAHDAPEVGQNFEAHQNNLKKMERRLINYSNHMPTTDEGKQMQKILTSMAGVCKQKSELIAANASLLSNLQNYGPAVHSLQQKMDAVNQQMIDLGSTSKDNSQATLAEKSESGMKMADLSIEYTKLSGEQDKFIKLNQEQENKISKLPPKLQAMADAKIATLPAPAPTISASQPMKLADPVQIEAAELTNKTYQSALDWLNTKIAHLFANGNKNAALTLIICRDKLEQTQQKEIQKSEQDKTNNVVKNVLPANTKKLGLVARIRVKFHASDAAKLGKSNKEFNPQLAKLNQTAAVASYIKGYCKLAGLSGADLPSAKSLRDDIRAGIHNTDHPVAFGREKPQEAVQNKPEVVSPVKTNPLQEKYQAKSKNFEADAISNYTKLILSQFSSSSLKAASLQDLFLARQRATNMLNDPAKKGSIDHSTNRNKIDHEIASRLQSDIAKSALFLDKDPKVLNHSRLISASEIESSLENVSDFKNIANERLVKSYSNMQDLDAAINVYFASNDGPAYGLLNDGNHWVTVLAKKNADGQVETYQVDTIGLQANTNKDLPNGCGPLQILMHAELSNRLKANPAADAIQTMKDIEVDLQGLDKQTLSNVVLQQRMVTLDEVIKKLPVPPPTQAVGFTEQIDDLANAFVI